MFGNSQPHREHGRAGPGATLTLDDLPAMVRRQSEAPELRLDIPRGLSLEQVEKAVVLQALEGCEGNRTQAARSFGDLGTHAATAVNGRHGHAGPCAAIDIKG